MQPVLIVRSRLHRPPVVTDYVVRSELSERLDAGSHLPLTLVLAPTGYGKTLLVSHWLSRRVPAAAWLSLTREESDPLRFVAYLVAAVRTVVPDACQETLRLLEQGQPSLAVLGALLSNDLEALNEPLLVVLDDYQAIDSADTHALLDGLLAHPPSALRLIIVTRRAPPLSLATLGVRGLLCELRGRLLEFNAQQSVDLIERCAGRCLSDAEKLLAQQCAEGWPVGARLVGMALRHGGRLDDRASALEGGLQWVDAYLREDVLTQQPDEIRRGLLVSAVVSRCCVELYAALVGEDVGTETSDLPAEAFVRVILGGDVPYQVIDDEGNWFRYHRLFRGFLLRQLPRFCSPEEIAQLHWRAATWCEARGELAEAVRHARAAGGDTAAGCLLTRHADELLGRHRRHELARCLRALSLDTVEQTPALLLLKAWLMHHQGRHIETAPVLDRIDALLGTNDAASVVPANDAPGLAGSLTALRSVQAYLSGQAEAATAGAERALALLPAGCQHARVLAQSVLAAGRQMSGDLSGAREFLRSALVNASGPVNACQAPLAATLCFIEWMAADLSALQWTANQAFDLNDMGSGCAGNMALGRYFVGIAHYQRNELGKAEAALLPALDPACAPLLGYRSEISIALAAVYQALGQAERARGIVDELCRHLERNEDLPALFRARAYQADLALRQGRTADAANWACNFDPGPVQFAYRFFNAPHLTLARVWLAQRSGESLDQAEQLLRLLESQLTAGNNHRFLIEVLALQAMLACLRGDQVATGERLARAVALARPGGLIRVFVDLGQDLVRPLKRLELARDAPRYLAQILSGLNDELLLSSGRRQLGDDLTRRELRILKLLALRLSNVEISEELCISRATVKRHTQNIYRKLCASNRRDAVTRASSLKLIGDR